MAEAQVGLWKDPKVMQVWRWKDLQAAMAIEPEQKLLRSQISDPSSSLSFSDACEKLCPNRP
jgi:hypothetical protein